LTLLPVVLYINGSPIVWLRINW